MWKNKAQKVWSERDLEGKTCKQVPVCFTMCVGIRKKSKWVQTFTERNKELKYKDFKDSKMIMKEKGT